jgi:ATP-dependent RNA circularization protein (DNA/RNA ligase family)
MADSVYDTASSPYTFRSDDQAALDRQHEMNLATVNAVAKVTGGSGAAAPAAPGAEPPPTPQQMGVQPPSIASGMKTAMASYAPAQSQVPEGIQDFASFGSNPIETALRTKAAQANMEQLNNPTAAFDVGAAASRENLDIAQRNQREQTRDELTRAYGGNASQVQTALHDADQQAILDRRGLNSDLATGRAQAGQQGITSAIQNALGFAGLGSQEKIAKTQLDAQAAEAAKNRNWSSAENQLGRQFTTSERSAVQAFQAAQEKGAQDWQSAEAQLGRTFTASERQAIQAYQTSERIASQTYASAEARLGREFTSTERAAIQAFQTAERQGAQDWQSAETQLGRKFTTSERQAIEAFQSSERVASQIYASAEADLGRKFTTTERQAVQDFQQAERLGAQDFQAAEAVLGRKFTSEEREAIQAYQTKERLSSQDFTQLMTEKGYVHDTDLEIMRDNLQRELQANGITADQARQQADQKFQELVQQRDQTFQATQTDLQRKWNTGERIDTQDFQKSIQANEFRQQDSLTQLQTLTQQAIAQGGWDNAAKLQAQQLMAQAAESEKARSAQYLMFSAQQAMEDQHFAAEFGLKSEEVKANIANSQEQIGIALKQLGITEEQWAMQKSDANFTKALELAQYGVSMWNGDNEEALQPFVTKLAQTLGAGLGLDPATMEKAIASSFAPEATTSTDGTLTPAQAFAAFDKLFDSKAASVSDADAEAAKIYAKKIANSFAASPSGVKISGLRDSVGGGNLDAAVAKLKATGTTDAVLSTIWNRDLSGDSFSGQKWVYKGTPELINYTLYTKLLNSGLAGADAKAAMVYLIGQEKTDAALALEGRKK